MKGSQQLAQELIDKVFTSSTLKRISDTLEDLSRNKGFKTHANDIINDDSLTDSQKKNQLLYIIKSVEIPTLYEFFSDQLGNFSFWMFSSGQIDYFDKFVQEFQLATEEIRIIKLATAVELSPEDLRAIAKNLQKSFGYKVVISHEVNPSIIGGIQIQIENLVFDYSVRSKFRHFSREWLKSVSKTQDSIGFHDPI